MAQSKSEVTKQDLFDALKRLTSKMPLDKITIQMLTDTCGYNRQTFYYHFQDIYGLLTWGFEQEVLSVLKKGLAGRHWQDRLMFLLNYVEMHHAFALAVIQSSAREILEQFFYDGIYDAIYALMDEMGSASDDKQRQFTVYFYTLAIAQLIARWLMDGRQQPPEEILQLLSPIVKNAAATVMTEEKADSLMSKKPCC